jgi:hypothetical protein
MSKYYTPEIEEFHVGFEYQFRIGSSWVDMVYTSAHGLEGRILTDLVRVKYLDREDIESLGFKYLKKGWGDESLVFRLNKSVGYELYFRGRGSCHITNSNEKVLFDGTIKNKSELKKVLKMIGI